MKPYDALTPEKKALVDQAYPNFKDEPKIVLPLKIDLKLDPTNGKRTCLVAGDLLVSSFDSQFALTMGDNNNVDLELDRLVADLL